MWAKERPAQGGPVMRVGTRDYRKNIEPYRECPLFHTCAVNRCPLHPDYEALESLPADRQRKCKASKAQRISVAIKYPGVLPLQGLTTMEWSRTPPEKRPETQIKGRDPARGDRPDARRGNIP